jgi:hypothetical protein
MRVQQMRNGGECCGLNIQTYRLMLAAALRRRREVRPGCGNHQSRAVGQHHHGAQLSASMCPLKHRERLPLERVSRSDNRYSRWSINEVVVGIVSSVPSTRSTTRPYGAFSISEYGME